MKPDSKQWLPSCNSLFTVLVTDPLDKERSAFDCSGAARVHPSSKRQQISKVVLHA